MRDSARLTTYIALPLAIISIVVAFYVRFRQPNLREPVGYAVVGTWVIVPPVWLWFSWVFSGKRPRNKEVDTEKEKEAEITHDLARNIWIALVVLLSAIFGITWPLE